MSLYVFTCVNSNSLGSIEVTVCSTFEKAKKLVEGAIFRDEDYDIIINLPVEDLTKYDKEHIENFLRVNSDLIDKFNRKFTYDPNEKSYCMHFDGLFFFIEVRSIDKEYYDENVDDINYNVQSVFEKGKKIMEELKKNE